MRKTVTISEIGKIITGHTPPTKQRRYYGDYRPFIKPTDIEKGTRFTNITEEGYSMEAAEKYRNSVVRAGATCVVTLGSVGEKITMAHTECFTNQSINAVIPNEKYDDLYVFYLLKHSLQIVAAHNNGTASGRDHVSKSNFSSIELIVEDDTEKQKRIGKYLGDIDRLVENNQKQIKLLEEVVQRLYKEWFEDLRFPGYEEVTIIDGIPKGWKIVELSEVVSINENNISKQYSKDYIDYIDIGSVSRGHIEAETRFSVQEAPGRAKRIAKDGDVIWGMVRPNLKSYALVFHPTETNVFSTGFAVLSAKEVPFSFLYCHVTQEKFVGYLVNCTNGAAYPSVKPIHFEKATLLLPTDDILMQFHYLAEPMYRKIEILENQIKKAKEARDRLLPKLMSGEIEV